MKISVIIPALNEAEQIGACLESVRRAGEPEIIVVDGGSTDATVALAQPSAIIIASARGRATQMNAGAAIATGDVLLFLHADSRVDASAFCAIEAACHDRDVAGGTFCLRFDDDHRLLRAYAWFTHLRPLLFHYGDQGIFVRREIFDALGGFAAMPLMEDVDFLRRLSKLGKRALCGCPVTTSARRFLEHGIVRQQLLNAALVLLFRAGAPVAMLARCYAPFRSGKERLNRAGKRRIRVHHLFQMVRGHATLDRERKQVNVL